VYWVSKHLREMCIAHRLPDHPGKCRFLHGHNYKVTLSVGSELLDDQGMVVDFKLLSDFDDAMQRKFDHTTILWEKDPIAALVSQALEDHLQHSLDGDSRVILVPYTPTVENLATEWLRVAKEFLGEKARSRSYAVKLLAHETANSFAEVS